MKKLKVAVLFMLLLTMLSATALAGTMYINRGKQKSVKMYNAKNEVICRIPYREAVETHSRSRIDSERMEVGYKGKWGWVYSRYLSTTRPPKVSESSSSSSSSSKKATGTMYVNRDKQKSIKMYNSKNEVICTIPYRAAVETHSRSKIDSERMEVGYKGKWGWVYSRYLSKTKPPKAGSNSSSSSSSSSVTENIFSGMKKVQHYTVVVRPSTPTGYVNLRWAPSTDAKIRSVRYNGDELRVIAENKNWAQVMDDSTGECGFMMKSLIEKVVVGG